VSTFLRAQGPTRRGLTLLDLRFVSSFCVWPQQGSSGRAWSVSVALFDTYPVRQCFFSWTGTACVLLAARSLLFLFASWHKTIASKIKTTSVSIFSAGHSRFQKNHRQNCSSLFTNIGTVILLPFHIAVHIGLISCLNVHLYIGYFGLLQQFRSTFFSQMAPIFQVR